MKFTLEIDCDNAAFQENDGDQYVEVARILREAADRIENGRDSIALIDLNGNRVGDAAFDRPEEG